MDIEAEFYSKMETRVRKAFADIKATLAKRLRDMRAATKDPWLAGQTDPYSHIGNH